MKYKIKVTSIWEFGKRVDAAGQPHQEDSLFPAHREARDTDRLFIVCDGMGGHDKGEVASATVCEAMAHTVLSECPDAQDPFSPKVLQDALSNAYDALDAVDSGAKKKMGTTMTFLKFHPAGYTAAHIGDSRIYQFRPGKDKQTTQILFKSEDHSLVNDLIKIGEITEEEARVHPQRNVITRAMQPHDERRPKADVHESSDIRPGDFFYMCTDGMLEQSDDNNLKLIFSDKISGIEAKTEALRKVSGENKDNHTAFIIEIISIEGKPAEAIECAPGECPLLVFKDKMPEEPAPLMANVYNQMAAMPPSNGYEPDPLTAGPPAMMSAPAAPASGRGTSAPAPMQKERSGGHGSVIIYLLVALLVVLIVAIVYFIGFRDKDSKKNHDDDDIRIEKSEIQAITPSRSYEESENQEQPTVNRTKVITVERTSGPAKSQPQTGKKPQPLAPNVKPTPTQKPPKKSTPDTQSTPQPAKDQNSLRDN